ncbi:glycosyl hydrolase [Streptomyces sp. NRRL S-813]|uniref:glycosyl hydrolase n=1 Tax=Streptomyces sp. NRRL S-813 TaxID=1463919 RepID=UPI00099B2DBE|nr:glycosyl hydrolase [Streptomyces sp. NRRL S-813]
MLQRSSIVPTGQNIGLPAAAADTVEHTVTLRNETEERIWVGSWSNADSLPLAKLPVLDPGQSATITIPEKSGAGHWRGRFFARQGCTGEDGTTFHCSVGNCGPFADHCTVSEEPTASLAEFNFDQHDAAGPWYDVSYVDAVSVPITITPDGEEPPQDGGECAKAGCPEDLLSACPPENMTRNQVTGKPLVCVNPNRDAQTAYSNAITQRCPKAYAWSRHDHVQGNGVMYQCRKCRGMTVTFHGTVGDTNHVQKKAVQPRDSNAGGLAPATVPAPRRGVALNPFDGVNEALADSGVSWYHNWTSSTGEVAKPAGVEYVPMIWGPGSVTAKELDQAKKEGKNLLTFHEPDSPTQSNISPERALDLWPQLEQTGLRLGSPAVAARAEQPGGWLDQFMQGAGERGLRVDFISLHWYGSDFGPDAVEQLRGFLQAVHDRYKKPIWLTEYALIDFSHGSPRYPNAQEQVSFLKSSTKMLDGLDFVERYAWSGLSTQTIPTGLYDGTTPNASGRAYREAD